MKKIVAAILLVAAGAALPAVPVLLSDAENAEKPQDVVLKEYIFEDSQEDSPVFSAEPYKILDISSGTVMEVPVRDYVIGAVCAEMPAAFHEEALKAQAVAAHTYAERQRSLAETSPDPTLLGADLSNDTSKYQGYFTESQMRHFFGENYDLYYEKISSAVDEVLPYILTYDGEPIISAFHSMSSGVTESAENAWGTAVDYLVPVDSEFDMEAPKYTEEVSYETDFLRQRLEKVFEGVQLGENIENWVIPMEKSSSGTVLTASVGNLQVTGGDIREALGLRSADFEVKAEEDTLIFTTHGYGHGVGMSQYGANTMANEGKTWREILEHYYVDVTLRKIDS